MASSDAIPAADYIIIGGGLAGCTLASRLHEGDPSASTIILEAGNDVKDHPLTSAPMACFAAHGSDIDWSYSTAPQAYLAKRNIYNAGGKALSGSSATNYGTWTRGSAADYDLWANIVGDERWSYNGMLPYFRRTEHHFDPFGDKQQHGFGGPIHTAKTSSSDPDEKRKYPLREPLSAAWEKIGIHYIPDGNSGAPLGFTEMVENWQEGKRQLASQAYDLSGIRILTSTLVYKVVISEMEGKEIATGVILANGHKIDAKKEVIICCGTYRTPQLLMLSGIGPRVDLSLHKVPIIVENPFVGQNLHDHLNFYQWWKLKHPERGLAMGTALWADPAYKSGKPCDWIAFTRASEDGIRAALASDGDPEDNGCVLLPGRAHMETLVVYAPSGAGASGNPIPFDGTHITSAVQVVLPSSRGSVTLRSAHPEDAPVIDPNYYSRETDRVIIREGARQVMRLLLETPEGKEIIQEETPPVGYTPLTAASSDEQIDQRVRRVGSSVWHAAGTAAMGTVVDAELCVKGVRGLRVVDASVLPIPISAHYQVCIYALAEQAADIILGKKSGSM